MNKYNALNYENTLLISGQEVRNLLKIEACMIAVEQAFRLHAQGVASPPKILGSHTKQPIIIAVAALIGITVKTIL